MLHKFSMTMIYQENFQTHDALAASMQSTNDNQDHNNEFRAIFQKPQYWKYQFIIIHHVTICLDYFSNRDSQLTLMWETD